MGCLCAIRQPLPLYLALNLWPPAADPRFPSRIPPTRARTPSSAPYAYHVRPARLYFLHIRLPLLPALGYNVSRPNNLLAAGMEAGMVKAMVLGGTAGPGERGVCDARMGQR